MVRFARLPKKQALYYRDLLCHRLGVTRSENYVGMFVDGKLTGISGYMGQAWCIGKRQGPFEVFGFAAHVKTYPRLNKLHMMCLTSRSFRDFWVSLYPGVLWPATHFATTCITKGHERPRPVKWCTKMTAGSSS